MRTTVIIKKRGIGYTGTILGKPGNAHVGERCGLTPYEAASKAAEYIIKYGVGNQEGASLMAPPEVLELVPEHLRSVAAK